MTAEHPLVVIGSHADARGVRSVLQSAGVADVAMLDVSVLRSVFDEDTDTWALHTEGGDVVRAHVVIDARRPWTPWIPKLPGGNDFRGVSFHAAAWDGGFDPSGKHIAVVGTDSAAAYHLQRLAQAAASVTVFAHAPRRVVADIPVWSTRVKRWLRRRTRPSAARPPVAVAASAIEAVTAAGVRTAEGVEHRVDAIVYGTGFFIPEDFADDSFIGAAGLTLRQAWHDGMEPFCGVAVRGFPNYYFLITGPDRDAQARYVADCLKVMAHTASGRIEVRASSQQVFNERAQLRPAKPPPVASAFDLSASAPAGDDAYSGAATLEIGGARHAVEVRLTGHLDPLDGRYHWQGTVFGSASEPLSEDLFKQARTGTLTIGQCSAPARIVEQTPWGSHSVAGVGAPPYALSNH